MDKAAEPPISLDKQPAISYYLLAAGSHPKIKRQRKTMKVTTRFGSEVRLISRVDASRVRVQSVALGDFSIKLISELCGDVDAALDLLREMAREEVYESRKDIIEC